MPRFLVLAAKSDFDPVAAQFRPGPGAEMKYVPLASVEEMREALQGYHADAIIGQSETDDLALRQLFTRVLAPQL